MLTTRCAAIAVATQFLFAISNVATAETPEIPAGLIDELHHWIDMTTDLPAADSRATIVFLDARDMAEPGEMASMIGSKARGLYDAQTGRIALVRPWSTENPQDVAVLLHELVHHRQSGRHYYCEAAKEHAAYHVQKDWLAERGLKLDVNWIAVVLASSCAARDIHP